MVSVSGWRCNISGESPDVVLYDASGNALALANGVAVPTSSIMVAGSDGTNLRFMSTDSSGRPVIVGAGVAGTPAGGVISIQGVASGTVIPISITGTNTISGTVTANIGTTNGLALDATLAKLTIAQGASLGTNTQALIGGSVTTAAPTYTTGQISPLSLDTSGNLRITGTISASNPSVSTTGAAPPASATYIGGSVTTAAPAYTTGQMNALSLTTTGLLRVDGSGVTQPVSGTVTANIGTTNGLALDTSVNGLLVSQGSTTSGQKGTLTLAAVTTAAPAYTTAQTSPLSLTTTGLLRVDGSGVTQPVSGTITANAGTGNFTVVQATAANLNATVTGTVTANIGTTNGLALDASVNGILVAQGSSTSGEKGPLIQGAVTTAAPTYTTAQTSPLSLTTAGALRVDGSGVTQPVSGTVTANQGGAPWSQNITQFGGVNISTGTGASGTGIPRVTVANDSNILATQSGTWTVQPGNTANTTPWLTTINQGGNSAAVKAASTAAAAADPSLVVGLSPNSPLPTGTNNIGSVNNVQTAESTAAWTSATANNTALALTVTGYGTVTVTLNQGTTITGGAVTFEASDTVAGTNWYPVSMMQTSSATVPASTYTLVANTNIAFQTNVAGFIQFRVRLSPAITGTGTVNVGIAANASAFDLEQASYLTDGTNGPVAVKAASTAPVAADKALVVTMSPNTPVIPVSIQTTNNSTPNLVFGDITLSSNASTVQINRTTYTEQTANFTGSVKSSSANDAAAGTGARTLTISYVDATGATAGTETVTLNGTTAVNLVTTTKCFIEKIIVNTAGSGGVSAGTISLFTGAAGAGTTVGTIQAGDNRTYWCHHYVVTGKTCNVTNVSHSNTSTVSGGNSTAQVRALTLNSANAAELQVSEFIQVPGAGAPSLKAYVATIQIAGPARVAMYVLPGANTSTIYQGSINCYDQ